MHFLIIGTLMGLSAGLAPGPLLTLVISETLQRDARAGVKVALAPILTDLPIVFFTLLVLTKISGFHHILGVISIIGGCFVAYMGYENIRTRGVRLDLDGGRINSLIKGVLANMLSPHPYLFWLSVGAPIMNKAMSQNITAVLSFIIGFYVFLVGSKITLAIIVGKSKWFLRGNIYIYTMRTLGLLLFVLALLLFREGYSLLMNH
ncbi:LysE family translocator [Desulfopila aestuarii]|uniref:Threonine/homoserine/homoserine lactone efflux protein n=1 Tax=Desulfopila aestuarii DSM 18488 TaxID=1121416 RepID=A0A1M7YF16_9BACT|nr:LysE family transporter [Desulfopila aestuarii]SHO51234.1 Threonine/homoserine/homoserine lactone efflux protein [Desulfopila aestuarii DSM 18488]